MNMNRWLLERQSDITGERKLPSLLSGNEYFVKHVRLEKVLEGHTGCVNTCSFTQDGSTLITGSDDLQIIMWDWRRGKEILRFASGHNNNVFQARALPHTNNRTIVTCAADWQVRLTLLNESGVAGKRRLARHLGRAHRLSLVPDEPQMFISSGEDGQVMLFDLRAHRRRNSETGTAATGASNEATGQGPVARMRVKTKTGRTVELHSVHHSPTRPWLFAAGGSDAICRVYDSRMSLSSCPGDLDDVPSKSTVSPPPVASLYPNHMLTMRGGKEVFGGFHVTGVSFNHQGQLLASYNDEDIYLFSAAGASGQTTELATTGKLGRSGADMEDSRADRKRKAVADAAEAGNAASKVSRDEHEANINTHETSMDQNSTQQEQPSKLQGSPDPHHQLAPGGEQQQQMDSPGAGLRRRLAAVVSLSTKPEDHVVQRYQGHRNCQTVKGAYFLGHSEEYIMSGSDCGHIYVWSKEGGKLLRCLRGDQYVVNCLETHPSLTLTFVTSGIEDTIKVWSPTVDPDYEPETENKIEEVTYTNLMRRDRVLRTREFMRTEREMSMQARRRRPEVSAVGAEAAAGEGEAGGGSTQSGGVRTRRNAGTAAGPSDKVDEDDQRDHDDDDVEDNSDDDDDDDEDDDGLLMRRALLRNLLGAAEGEQGGAAGALLRVLFAQSGAYGTDDEDDFDATSNDDDGDDSDEDKGHEECDGEDDDNQDDDGAGDGSDDGDVEGSGQPRPRRSGSGSGNVGHQISREDMEALLDSQFPEWARGATDSHANTSDSEGMDTSGEDGDDGDGNDDDSDSANHSDGGGGEGNE